MTDLYRIETRYAVGGIEISKGVVVKAAPIFRHLEGRLLPNVENWARSNHAKIEKVEPGPQSQSGPKEPHA